MYEQALARAIRFRFEDARPECRAARHHPRVPLAEDAAELLGCRRDAAQFFASHHLEGADDGARPLAVQPALCLGR